MALDLFDKCRIGVTELEGWLRGDDATPMGKVLRQQQRFMKRVGR